MTPVVVFDDGHGRLAPLTDLRASFMVRTGALNTHERLAAVLELTGVGKVSAVHVPERLAPVTRESLKLPVNSLADLKEAPKNAGLLLVNGRCVLPPGDLGDLKIGSALTARAGGAVVAARLSSKDAAEYLDSGRLPSTVQTSETDAAMLERPWDMIRHRDSALDVDLELLSQRDSQELPPGVIAINEENITISPDATVYPGVVLDAENGRIVIDDGATIRPGAILIGPAYIGKGSTVLDRTLIKAHTAIGPVCKVAGELGGTIFQGFANKAHDGHLGDSWVGEWANFGAGTTNSNLLNTYGEITAQGIAPGSSRERTGLMYLGAIVGDHVKFAICTRIMTGSILGTGAMIATSKPPPTSVAPFTWLTDEREQSYRLSKFVDVAKTMMARRKVTPSTGYIELLEALSQRSGQSQP